MAVRLEEIGIDLAHDLIDECIIGIDDERHDACVAARDLSQGFRRFRRKHCAGFRIEDEAYQIGAGASAAFTVSGVDRPQI